MYSVGIDLIEIKRIEKAMKRDTFCKRILGSNEYDELKKRGFPAQSVAVNFCAKEAFLKALGFGIFDMSLKEIELLRAESGRPYFKLNGKVKSYIDKKGIQFSVSATHTKDYASVVVLATSDEREVQDDRRD